MIRLHLQWILGFHGLNGRVHRIGHVHPHTTGTIPRGLCPLPAPVGLVKNERSPIVTLATDDYYARGGRAPGHNTLGQHWRQGLKDGIDNALRRFMIAAD
jgi:hypothetical protein